MQIMETGMHTAGDTILVVDDEEPVLESLEMLLEGSFRVITADSGEKAIRLLRENDVHVAILDVIMPGMGGMATLDKIVSMPDHPEVVMLSASDSARMGAKAVKNGAFDYIAKPFDSHELLEVTRKALEKRRLKREVDFLRSEVVKLSGFGNIVGRSKRMQEVLQIVQRICGTDSNVLITGESGTGKELIARSIHAGGSRSGGPFIPVNCAAIPRELLESEFFGHEKGSFTGAHERRTGKFELSNGGTLFLDELSTLQLDLQAKLLRVLQEREFTRVGGSRIIRVDIQIISATNQDLKKAVNTGVFRQDLKDLIRKGLFREDLYYRLNVLPIDLPPLRERRGDIPVLARFILEKIAYRMNRPVADITPEAIEQLKDHYWPGNIRELENMLERLVAFSPGGRPIDILDLPNELLFPETDVHRRVEDTKGLIEARDRFERLYILSALRKVDWNQSEAARVLGILRNTLIKKISSLGLKAPIEQKYNLD